MSLFCIPIRRFDMYVSLNAYLLWHSQIYFFILFLPIAILHLLLVLSYELNKLRGKYIFQDEKLTFIYKTKTILCKNMLVMSVWIQFLLVLEVRIFIFFKTLQHQELVILTLIKCGFALFCYYCSP